MKRRDFVKTAGAGSAAAGAAIAASSFPAPAVAQGTKRFKMVTT
jgi:anaerobic selenocysteine-containing dehydrogenase